MTNQNTFGTWTIRYGSDGNGTFVVVTNEAGVMRLCEKISDVPRNAPSELRNAAHDHMYGTTVDANPEDRPGYTGAFKPVGCL